MSTGQFVIKSSCLALTLGVTQLTDMISVILCCSTQVRLKCSTNPPLKTRHGYSNVHLKKFVRIFVNIKPESWNDFFNQNWPDGCWIFLKVHLRARFCRAFSLATYLPRLLKNTSVRNRACKGTFAKHKFLLKSPIFVFTNFLSRKMDP